MKKLFLILCLSTAIINAMDDDDDILSGEKQLQAISQAMPELETALEKWQIAVQQNPLSAITDKESAEKAVDAIRKPRYDAYEPSKTVQPLALINLLTLQPESDNPHNRTVLALLSSFSKLKPQLEAHEAKFREYSDLRSKMSTLKWATDALRGDQESYEKTAKALQAHLNRQKTKESFFEEHAKDYSMINTPDKFNMYSKYFTADTHQIRKDLDGDAFQKDWTEWYEKYRAENESKK